ncbi:hypothetical protein ACU4GD_36895 [Cupriavidus basilensis]
MLALWLPGPCRKRHARDVPSPGPAPGHQRLLCGFGHGPHHAEGLQRSLRSETAGRERLGIATAMLQSLRMVGGMVAPRSSARWFHA